MNRLQNPNIMIDIETLGIGPNSVIATIGAMKFDRTSSIKPIEEMTSFYYRIDLESCQTLGMTSEEETVKWWDNQDEKSKEEIYDMWEKCIEIYEHNRKSIFYHVNSFEDFFKKTFPRHLKIF